MEAVAYVAVALLVWALVARRLQRTALTGAIFFAAVGVLGSQDVFGVFTRSAHAENVKSVLEATLAVVLFVDASATTATTLVRERTLPLRLLGVGLPLSILLGWGAALVLLPGLALWEAALVGAILAPTDAALGEAVISDPRVPALVRDDLAVESGLNDGLALPFVTIFLALSLTAAGQEGSVNVLETFLRAIVVSTALGVAIAWVAARLLLWTQDRGWSDPPWQPVALLGVVALAYVSADAAHGSGFIATWVAGMTTGTVVRGRLKTTDGFLGTLTDLLTSVSFLLFGALFLVPAVSSATWHQWGYALLSLTLVRMLPVALSLLGTGMSRATALYVGWFGPRGLASLIFAGAVVENELPNAAPVVNVVMLTVALSIVLHGVTAWWGAERYADWFERASAARADLPEAAASAPVARRRAIPPGGPPGA